MSGGYPLYHNLCGGSVVGTDTNTNMQGTQITSSATVNAKGSWSQLIASTTADTTFVIVNMETNVTARFGVDIGVGASGSEVVLVPDLVCDSYTSGGGGAFWASASFPLHIPAGTRVATRCAASVASSVVGVTLRVFDGDYTTADVQGYDTIGYTATTQASTAVTPSTTNNTAGSYAQLVASTPRDYAGFFIMTDANSHTVQFGRYTFDLAIGASGSETIIMPTIDCNDSAFQIGNRFKPYIPINIPAGTRIAARSYVSAQNDPFFGMVLYGAVV